MTRRTYRFTEYLGRAKKLSTYNLTSSKKETERRAEHCRKKGYPYCITNRLTNEVVEEWEPLYITDVIRHRNKDSVQTFILLDREPNFVFERNGNWLIAEDNGFYCFYYHQRPVGRREYGGYAFGGREFDIPLKSGETIKANGQWWDGVPDKYRNMVISTGYGTAESLARCNVFCSVYVKPELVENWLSENEPSNNYDKYNPKHADFGKQIIKSRWGDAQ